MILRHSYIHGFEDYKIVSMWSNSLFDPNRDDVFLPYNFCYNGDTDLINKDLPVLCRSTEHPRYHYNRIDFVPSLYTNNNELLEKAKKVYVHPSCKLSRSMMAEKYKKSLDPWTADVVVVPKPDYSDLRIDDYVLFINDKAKMIVKVLLSEFFKDFNIEFKEGDRLGDYLQGKGLDARAHSYSTQDFCDSEFFYKGELLTIPNSCRHILDLLTCGIPRNKTVYEETIQESLGGETNQLDFDSLTSIKDMLESTDENTVSAGLKSLSMMDWMHYPNCVKFILRQASNRNWKWNKAISSTSVKYMLKTITGAPNRNRWPGDYDYNIFNEDLELLKKLKAHYDHVDDNQMQSWLRFLNFMRVSDQGVLMPILRERTV